MKTMRNVIIGIAKTSKNFDEFCDKIYGLGSYVIISDLDDNIVEYIDKNDKWHTVDVSKYTVNFD
jgi:hypothetical protein